MKKDAFKISSNVVKHWLNITGGMNNQVKILTHVLLLVVALNIVSLFIPGLFISITFTYQLLYATTRTCFPNFTNLAFLFLIIAPQIVLFVLCVLALPVNVPALFLNWLQKKINKILKQEGTGWQGIFNRLDNYLYKDYEWELLRQFLLSIAITLLFVTLYFVLQLFIHDEKYFFNAQLKLSLLYIVVLFIQLGAVLYARKSRVLAFLQTFFTEKGSSYNLAILRIILCAYLAGIYRTHMQELVYWSALPHEMRVSMPFMGWFIQNVPINPAIYITACKMGYVCALMGVAGIFTPVVLLINIPLSIYVIGVPMFFGKLFHMHIWVWFPTILAFSQCADVISIDSLFKKYYLAKPAPPAWHPRYGVPLRLIWIHLGIIYFFAGLIKLKDSGLTWALGPSMINQMQVEWAQHYNHVPLFRIDHYPALAHAAGIGVILFELYYPFLLLCSAGRLITAAGGIAMHNIIDYFMYIGFGDLQRTYLSYINWHRIVLWLKKPVWPAKLLQPLNSDIPFSQLLRDITFKRVLIVGLTIYSINFTFGLFKIHSWPFSSYPTYSQLVPSTHIYVYYKPFTPTGDTLDIYKLGKQDVFRMESYTPIEDRINENIQIADTATMHTNIIKLWDIWKSNVKELRAADSVEVYLRKSPVAPETADSLIENRLIMTFKNQ